MLKVWIDYSTIAFDNLTGIGRYIVETSLVLQKNPEIQLEGACKLSRWKNRYKIQRHLSDIPLHVLPSLKRPDLFHGPDFAMHYYGKAKKVVTIHDLAVFHPNLVDSRRVESPQQGKIQKLLRSNRIDAIITVSEFVKKEILHFFPHLDKPIFVTPLAANHRNFTFQKQTSKPFLLYVGPLDRRKNVLGLCKAFELIAERYPEFRLTMVGGSNGFESEKVFEFIQESRFRKQFEYLSFVSDQELQNLYATAWAFVFPSFYEGFGIPVLEAMHYELPVLTSRDTTMQEVAGDAAFFVNPYEITDIAEGLQKIISDTNLRTELIQKAKRRLALFSWERTARKTLDAYITILS
ncbi:MAG: glycosyltransferase family 4 protein [Bacteroidia bacterium]|nr:glycosyltransferase family 4 protein [Bacteroidia bacterium]MDW8303112.1 glycosyltransferase family 1 protein [Bacteroidia bacterium]